MADTDNTPLPAQLGGMLVAVLNSRWAEALVGLWRLGRKIASGLAEEGMYEVLEYESTLELLDPRGDQAQFRKRERVRYLQSQIIAYQDQAWADGEILLDYQCTPGVPVDQYRPGHETYILIALREVKARGDVDEFNISWGMRHSFPRATEQWETEVRHRIRKLRVQLIFPASRPPLRVALLTGSSRKSKALSEETQVKLPDGRWQVTWENDKPRLHERYILKWDW